MRSFRRAVPVVAGVLLTTTSVLAGVGCAPPSGAITNPSTARGINNAGVMVGSMTVGGRDHAFVSYPDGPTRDLGTMGGVRSVADDVNEAGTVVGFVQSLTGVQNAFRWTAAAGMRKLPAPPGGTGVEATAINAGGLIVGTAGTEDHARALVWKPDGSAPVELPSPNGRATRAEGVNDRGEIVGVAGFDPDRSSPPEQAVLWEPDAALGTWSAVVLASRGSVSARALDIDNAGDVVGLGSDGRLYGATLWRAPDHNLEMLPVISGPVAILATGLSDTGIIVGVDDRQGAVAWRFGAGVDTVAQPVVIAPTPALGIRWRVNSAGTVAGTVTDEGQSSAVRLKVPPPPVPG
jgi:probable HAF family extracellular repeat protein